MTGGPASRVSEIRGEGVSAPAYGQMMPPKLTAAMEATAAAVFEAATTTLLPQGLSPAPQAFVFDRLDGAKLVGQVTCRPYLPKYLFTNCVLLHCWTRITHR